MDKAVGRRKCTRKKLTQDVSVVPRSCLGDVSVVSVMCRSCLGDVSVVSRCFFGGASVLVLFWRCFADVSGMFGGRLGFV